MIQTGSGLLHSLSSSCRYRVQKDWQKIDQDRESPPIILLRLQVQYMVQEDSGKIGPDRELSPPIILLQLQVQGAEGLGKD